MFMERGFLVPLGVGVNYSQSLLLVIKKNPKYISSIAEQFFLNELTISSKYQLSPIKYVFLYFLAYAKYNSVFFHVGFPNLISLNNMVM